MRAGKKTETIQVSEWQPRSLGWSGNTSMKNLSKSDLGGAIFGCTHNTMEECLTKQLFGLPSSHFNFVKNIDPGLTLFLFNYSNRTMHGIYEAASTGEMNIDPYAWTDNSKEKTGFPAQVRIRLRMQCQSITENQFKRVITDNYYKLQHFSFELNHAQTEGLIASFLASNPSISARVLPAASPDDTIDKRIKRRSVATTSFTTNLKKEFREPYSYRDNSIEENVGASHGEYHIVSRAAEASKAYASGDINEGSMILGNSSDLVIKEGTSASDLCIKNTALMQTVKELKERAAALVKKQFESELEMEQLRNVVKDSGAEIQQLNHYIKGLESKLMRSLSSENVIFLIGGFNGKSWLSALDSFSPSMDKLMPLKSMGSTRSYASSAALNGNLYVFGGGDGSSWFSTADCYNPLSDNWTSCSPLTREKGSLAGATLNGKIFAVGGGNGSDCFSDVEMFDPTLGKWICNQSMLQKRFAPGAAELHGVLYATGGFDGKDYLRTAERLDPRVGYWTKVPKMKSRRGCHSMAVFNEKLYVMGGFDGKKMVSTVETFDPRNNSWTECVPLNFVRGYGASAVLGGSLFIMGGVDDDNDIVETVECFSEATGWVTCTHKAIGKRSFFSAAVVP